jgi:predicted hydrolase (HD superfamily)
MSKLGLTYEQANDLLDVHVIEPITKLHCRESEIIMRALAMRFGENEEEWGIIGLLHDIDWDQVKGDPSQHCIVAQKILREAGASDFLIEVIISHGYGMEEIPDLKDRERKAKLHHCLVAAETLTGLIYASALMQPDKKLASVSFSSLKKKFKNKSFAAKCNREAIRECEKAGIELDEFLQIGLTAMQGAADELGL